MNRVCLVGNLGRDPELTQTHSGKTVCRMTVATTETSYDAQKKEKKEITEWHNVVVWNKQGENCAKYLKKGSKVAVEGSIRTESYDDKKTGVKKWTTKIIANKVEFLNSQQKDYEAQQTAPDDEGQLPPMPEDFYENVPF